MIDLIREALARERAFRDARVTFARGRYRVEATHVQGLVCTCDLEADYAADLARRDDLGRVAGLLFDAVTVSTALELKS